MQYYPENSLQCDRQYLQYNTIQYNSLTEYLGLRPMYIDVVKHSYIEERNTNCY